DGRCINLHLTVAAHVRNGDKAMKISHPFARPTAPSHRHRWQLEVQVHDRLHRFQELVKSIDSKSDERHAKVKTILQSNRPLALMSRQNRLNEPVLNMVEVVDDIHHLRACRTGEKVS